MKLTNSNIKYLLCIYNLLKEKNEVSSVDISRRLNVTKSSVCKMMVTLSKKNLIKKEPYKKIGLTDKGIELVNSFYEKSSSLINYLTKNFDVTDEKAHYIAGNVMNELLIK